VLDRAFGVAEEMVAQGEHPYLVVGVSDARRAGYNILDTPSGRT
jgi:hypothetical protein